MRIKDLKEAQANTVRIAINFTITEPKDYPGNPMHEIERGNAVSCLSQEGMESHLRDSYNVDPDLIYKAVEEVYPEMIEQAFEIFKGYGLSPEDIVKFAVYDLKMNPKIVEKILDEEGEEYDNILRQMFLSDKWDTGEDRESALEQMGLITIGDWGDRFGWTNSWTWGDYAEDLNDYVDGINFGTSGNYEQWKNDPPSYRGKMFWTLTPKDWNNQEVNGQYVLQARSPDMSPADAKVEAKKVVKGLKASGAKVLNIETVVVG